MPEPYDRPGGRRSGAWQGGLREAGPYLSLGLQLAAVMALFTLGGYALDEWLGTTPWLLIAGAVVGMVAFFAQVVRLNQTLSARQKRRPASGTVRRDAFAGNRAGVAGPERGSGASGPAVPGPGAAPASGAGIAEESFSELERRFASSGVVREGMLLLEPWDAVDLIEAARAAYVPVRAVETYVATGAGFRPVDTFQVSVHERSRRGWDEAARFVEDLREGGLRFRVVLGAGG